MSVDHYENFPVASVLCPPALRPAVASIYWFARTADDIADEGDAPAPARSAELAMYRADLAAVLRGDRPSARWQGVFDALARSIERYRIPGEPLHDLLSAFEQDVVKHRYADRAELLDYCRRSANPVGRLILHLHGVNDPRAIRQSDAICTALQLANFWQDFGVDTARGRIYPPQADMDHHGVSESDLLARRDSPAARALVADLAGWARGLMLQGAPLVHAVPGRAGWELRFVVQGGLRILDKAKAMDHATLLARPRLRWYDLPLLSWRAFCMRRESAAMARNAT